MTLPVIIPPEQAEPGDPCGLISFDETEPSTICDGQLEAWIDARGKHPGCHCHLSPPCHACMTAPLICDTCDEEVP